MFVPQSNNAPPRSCRSRIKTPPGTTHTKQNTQSHYDTRAINHGMRRVMLEQMPGFVQVSGALPAMFILLRPSHHHHDMGPGEMNIETHMQREMSSHVHV